MQFCSLALVVGGASGEVAGLSCELVYRLKPKADRRASTHSLGASRIFDNPCFQLSLFSSSLNGSFATPVLVGSGPELQKALGLLVASRRAECFAEGFRAPGSRLLGAGRLTGFPSFKLQGRDGGRAARSICGSNLPPA